MKKLFLKRTLAVLLAAVLLISFDGCHKKAPVVSDSEISDTESMSENSSDISDTSGVSDVSDSSSIDESTQSLESGSSKSNEKTATTKKSTVKPTPTSTGNQVFKVEDYGAKGDGKTDDGPAISKAVDAAANASTSGEKVVQFKTNATYRVTSVPSSNDYKRLICLQEADNVKIRGNNTKLLMKAPIRTAVFNDTTNCEMSGFIIDYSPKPFVKGTLVSKGNATMDFQVSGGDLGFSGSSWQAPETFFALRNRTDERRHYMISKYQNLGGGKFRASIKDSSLNVLSIAQVGDEFILPYANNSHNIGGGFQIHGSSNFAMKNVRIMSQPDFGFGLRFNVGKIYFTNVDFKEDENLGIHLIQWRDGFHIKDNTAPIIWSGCDIGPLGDDAFNLSSVNLNVNTVSSDQKMIGMTPAEGDSERPKIKPGDDFVAFDLKSGKEIGRGKVEEIVPSGDPVCFRSNVALPGLEPGMQIGVYSYANPGSIIKDCTIEGTVRVRSITSFQNVKFNVFWVRVENESYIEGPIPKDISFKNCTFSTPYTNNPEIFVVGTQSSFGKRNAFYKCRNIVLDGCKFTNGKYYVESGNELIVK